MAYRDGVWKSDRETRKDNERMWNEHKAKKGPGGKGDDDLARAMASEGTEGTEHTKPAGGSGGSGTLGLSNYLGSGSTVTQTIGTKITRPIVPGGCDHTGQKLSITLSDGKRLYGAQAYHIKETAHLELIVDCAGLLKPRPKFVAKATAPRFRSLDTSTYPDVVTLAWPDMTAPTHVGYRFWERLRDLLPQDTAVCCMGGHGRTGTALAALLVADGEDPEVAIKRVRKEHCPRAIETIQQEQYIKGLAKERDSRKGLAKDRGAK